MDQKTTDFWVILFLRFTLAILFIFAGLTYLLDLTFFIAPTEKVNPWFPVNYTMLLSKAIAAALILIGALFALGYRMIVVSLLSTGLLLVIHILLLINNPFYNTLNHIVPYLLMSLGIFYLSQRQNNLRVKVSSIKNAFVNLDHISVVSFCLRYLVAAIFIFQGFTSLTKGPIIFAEKLYVLKFQDTILPEPMLWTAGVLNPFLQLIGGAFLILGFKTYHTIIILCFFMLSIVFGHMFINPYETEGKLTSHGLNNFLFLISALYFTSLANRYSLDNYFSMKRELKTEKYP